MIEVGASQGRVEESGITVVHAEVLQACEGAAGCAGFGNRGIKNDVFEASTDLFRNPLLGDKPWQFLPMYGRATSFSSFLSTDT